MSIRGAINSNQQSQHLEDNALISTVNNPDSDILIDNSDSKDEKVEVAADTGSEAVSIKYESVKTVDDGTADSILVSTMDEERKTYVDSNGEEQEEPTQKEILTETRQIVVSADFVSNEDKDKIIDIIGDYAIIEFDNADEAIEAYEQYQDSSAEVYTPQLMHVNDTGLSDYKRLSWGYKSVNASAFNRAFLAKYGSVENIPEVIVGVIDSGVEYTHTYLKDRVVDYKYDYVDGDNDAMDEESHGTHIAGIITDVTLPNVKIAAYRVMDARGYGYDTNIALAIKQAADDGASVINLSLGGKHSSSLMEAALDYAMEKGVIPVIAAGNESEDCDWSCPGHYRNALTVASMNENREISWFSNYGNGIDITAPGEGIYSSVLNNSYETKSGTSMATPYVAAAAASLIAYLNDDSFTPEDIEGILKQYTTDICSPGFDISSGYGLLNMGKIAEEVSSPSWKWNGMTMAPVITYDTDEESEITVEIKSEEGAVIYYTEDGSIPRIDGSNPATKVYKGTLTYYSDSVDITAIAKAENKFASDLVYETCFLYSYHRNFIVNKEGVLVKYTGDESILYIPEKVGVTEVKKLGPDFLIDSIVEEVYVPDSVTHILYWAFGGSDVIRLHLGKNVQYIGTQIFGASTYVEEVIIDPENPYFVVENGGLYSKDYEYLYTIAAFHDGSDYYIHDGCKYALKGIHYGSTAIRIHVPASLTDLESDSTFDEGHYRYFSEYLKRVRYIVDEGNSYYSCDDYALYNGDKTVLLGYYMYNTNPVFEMPDSVRTIEDAFFICPDLTSVILSNNLERLEAYAFHSTCIEEFTMPASVNYMGYSCLGGENSVTVYFDGDFPKDVSDINEGKPIDIYRYTWAAGFEKGVSELGKYSKVNVFDRDFNRIIEVSIPEGYDTTKLFFNGVEYQTTYNEDSDMYCIVTDGTKSGALMAYKDNGAGEPRDMHIWEVDFIKNAYVLTEQLFNISENGILKEYQGNDISVTTPENIVGYPVRSLGCDLLTGTSVKKITVNSKITSIEDGAMGGIEGLTIYFDGNCPSLSNINNGKTINIYIYGWADGFEEGISELRKYGTVNVYYRDYSTLIAVDIPEGYDTGRLWLDGEEYETSYDTETGKYGVNLPSVSVSIVAAKKNDYQEGAVYVHGWTAEHIGDRYVVTDTFCDVTEDGQLVKCTSTDEVLYIPSSVGGVEVTLLSYRLDLPRTANEVYVPDSVTTIEPGPFHYENEIIHLGKKVQNIGVQAFGYTDTEIMVDPENPYIIATDGALYSSNYEYLFSIFGNGTDDCFYIHEGCKYIVKGAAYATRAHNIYMPASVEQFSSETNYDQRHGGYGSSYIVYYQYIADSNSPYYYSENGVLYSKDKSVLYSYYYDNDADSFVVPESVRTISRDAFSFSKLEEIVLQEGLNTIEFGAFWHTSLKEYVIPASVSCMETNSFIVWDSLTLYFNGDCPANIEPVNGSYPIDIYIYPWAKGFDEGIKKLARAGSKVTVHEREYDSHISLSIPDGFDNTALYLDGDAVKTSFNAETGLYTVDNRRTDITKVEARKLKEDGLVESSIFWEAEYKEGKYALTFIPYEIAPDGTLIKYLGNEESVRIPDNISGIEVQAIASYFMDNTVSREVILPDSLTELSDYSFANAVSLRKIYIGKSVSDIGFLAIPYTGVDITVSDANGCFTVKDNVMYSKDMTVLYGYGKHEGASQFTVPGSVTRIAKLAFYNNKSLDTVYLNDGLKTIEQYAFAGCDLMDTYVIPPSVERLEDCALGDGKLHISVYFDGNCPASVGNINNGGDVDVHKYPRALGFDTNLEYLKQFSNVSVLNREVDTSIVVNIPEGYDTSVLYLDGVEYQTEYNTTSGEYIVDNGSEEVSTVTAFKLNAAGSPIGMYVWTAEYDGKGYVVNAHPEFENLMNYRGFSIRIRGYSGIRYTAVISTETKQQLASDEGFNGFRLKEYGVIALPRAYMAKYPLVVGGAYVNGTIDYKKADDGTVSEILFERKDGFDSFTGLLIKIPESGYNTDIAFRSYIVLEKDGQTYTIYQKPVVRSIYYLASQYINRKMYEEGTYEYEYLTNIINIVDGAAGE